mmetsp:Transcript_16472/g.41069  ORF Transcript_16472/g.41069 Transcript_16472/m.41069 type:complete len:377 (-) Transcript_16472:247-1377(-)
MRAAHGVDVAALHQRDVTHHVLLGQHAPGARVPLVAVHAAQHHGHTIVQQPGLVHPGLSEAHVAGLVLQRRAARPAQLQRQRVQRRLLRAPQRRQLPAQRAPHVQRQLGHPALPHSAQAGMAGRVRRVPRARTDGQRARLHDGPPAARLHQVRHQRARAQVARVRRCHVHGHLQPCAVQLQPLTPLLRLPPRQRCGHLGVGDVRGGLGEQPYGAVQATEAPHVLVLQVAAVTPAHHRHRQRVGAAPHRHQPRHLELGSQPAVLAQPEESAVQPDGQAAVGALKPQEHPAGARVVMGRRVRERGAVAASGVVVVRYKGWGAREWVHKVGVDGCAMALAFPIGWNTNLPPVKLPVVHRPEAIWDCSRVWVQLEPPVTA